MFMDAYLKQSNFLEKSDLERAKLLAFYLHQVDNQPTITMKEIANLLYVHGFTQPDLSRLEQNMIKSKSFVDDQEVGTYRLQKNELEELKRQFPQIDKSTEEIESDDFIVPENLSLGRESYIEQVARQINASYHYGLYDGSILLMQKFLKMLLVQIYEQTGRKKEIQNSNETSHVKDPIQYIITNGDSPLSKDSLQVLDEIKEWEGAYTKKITYTASKSDVDIIRPKFRALVRELLYMSQIKQ